MDSKIKILIIEDDNSINTFIGATLENNGYNVRSAFCAKEGVKQVNLFGPNVVLLDLGLPDMDGEDVIRQLRSWSNIPIIVISARNRELDKVNALDLGADDYITKPFGSAEMMARIRTSLRHNHKNETSNIYRANDLEINFEKRTVMVEGRDVHLTQIEYQLLKILAENSGRVLTYGFVMSAIWGPYVDDNNQILRVNMANIRRKIEKNPAQPQYVFTEVGVGYRMLENEYVGEYVL